MKNRVDLAKYFGELGFKIGAEVGVFGGHYSEVLCRSIPGLKLYGVDPYTHYEHYRDHRFESSFKRAEDLAHSRLAEFDVTFIKKFSADAAKDIPNGSLDFVYIDGNHDYSYVKEDMDLWAPKVRKGGIVSGDDYYISPTGNDGVIRAVNEYTVKHNVDMRIIPPDKTTPTITHDDRQPQWFFIRS